MVKVKIEREKEKPGNRRIWQGEACPECSLPSPIVSSFALSSQKRNLYFKVLQLPIHPSKRYAVAYRIDIYKQKN